MQESDSDPGPKELSWAEGVRNGEVRTLVGSKQRKGSVWPLGSRTDSIPWVLVLGDGS